MRMNDDIHNYYEKLVLEEIERLAVDKTRDDDYIADLCCLVLNRLPPRYIRYEVDMAFYLPQSKRLDMELNVRNAMREALEFLDARRSES